VWCLQSEEDIQKKEELDLLVTRTQDADEGIARVALETLKTEIKSATSSMTAVPKPLKFLRPHYDLLKSVYEKLPEGENKVRALSLLLLDLLLHCMLIAAPSRSFCFFFNYFSCTRS
jgi:hypothetical protein